MSIKGGMEEGTGKKSEKINSATQDELPFG